MRRSPSPTLRFSPALNRPVVDPELLGAALEVGQVVVVLDLVAELDQPDAALLEHQGVVVPLVPALEPELAGLLVHDLHAEGVGVVVAGFFEVGHPQVHVPQPNNGTCLTHPTFLSFLLRWRDSVAGPPRGGFARSSGRRIPRTRLSRSPSWSSITMLVIGTARQLRQIPSTRSSSLSTLVGDRALVTDLAELELHLADSATAAPAADPVTQPGPRQRAQQRLAVRGLDAHAVGEDVRHLG